MRLNTDYSDIKRQMIELVDSLRRTTNREDFYRKYTTFYALNYVYSLKKRHHITLSSELEEFGTMCYDEVSNASIESFCANRLYHRDVLTRSFYDTSEMMVDIVTSKYFRKLQKSSFPRIKDEERREILDEFFKENFPEGRSILEDVCWKRHLYSFSAASLMNTDAFLIFNNSDFDSNIFLHKRPRSVSAIAALVHELGHAYDYSEGISKNNSIVSDIFTETLSCYYNQLFLEYLLKNEIREREVTFSFIEFFSSFFAYFDSGILLTLLSDEEYRKVFDGTIMRKSIVKSLKEKKLIEEWEFSFAAPSAILDGKDENRYSYGVLIANMIINGEIAFDDFMSIRDKSFSSERLESIGFSAEKAKKSLVKTMNRTMIKKM